MIVPGSEREVQTPADAIHNAAEIESSALELPAAPDDAHPRASQVSYLEIEDRQLQTYAVIIASVVACVAIGWLTGPMLTGPMESLTGTPVENSADLRPTGGVLGLLAGFLIGATAGWAIWSGR